MFVEERRPILVARKLRRGAGAGDIVLVRVREKGRSLRGEVTKVLGSPDDPRNVYEALFASIATSRAFSQRSRKKPSWRPAKRLASAKTFAGYRP